MHVWYSGTPGPAKFTPPTGDRGGRLQTDVGLPRSDPAGPSRRVGEQFIVVPIGGRIYGSGWVAGVAIVSDASTALSFGSDTDCKPAGGPHSSSPVWARAS